MTCWLRVEFNCVYKVATGHLKQFAAEDRGSLSPQDDPVPVEPDSYEPLPR